MNRKPLVNYFEAARYVPLTQTYILADIDVRSVPVLLSSLETRRARSFWASEDDYVRGNDIITDTEVRLLMDATTRLIREIRATRGVDNLEPGYDNPDTDPFTLSMGTIEDVERRLETANEHLAAIRTALETQQSPEELAEIVQQLGTIAALLA